MLAEQAKLWCSGGRRNVSIDGSSQIEGAARVTCWAYDFTVMHGMFIDIDDPHWPSTEELKEMRLAELRKQIEEALGVLQ